MEEKKKIGFFKRLKMAIFNLEDYKIFASETFSEAAKYLLILIAIIAVILGISTTISFRQEFDTFISYIENEFPNFNYSEETLTVDEYVEVYNEEYEAKLIVDTTTEATDEKLEEYQDLADDGYYSLILFNNKGYFYVGGYEYQITYSDVMTNLGLESITKQELFETYLTDDSIFNITFVVFIYAIVYLFMSNILVLIEDVVIIAIFGWLASKIAKVNLKFSQIASLSVYSVTLSLILSVIYSVVYTFTEFEIKYFSLMYMIIAYIYIVASIMIIKDDINKMVGEGIPIKEGAIEVKGEIEEKKEEPEEKEEDNLSYDALLTSLQANEVEKIEMQSGSSSLTVTFKGEEDEEERTETVNVPSLQAFMELVNEKIDSGEFDVEIVQTSQNAFVSAITNIIAYIPTILLVVLIIMIFKMQGLGGDSGKVYGNGEDSKKSKVKFEDVAGLDEEKAELVEVVDFLKQPDEYLKMGAKIPRGILLYGKPGTGKTLIAKAIAGEAGVPFISMSGSEFIEMFAGLGASRVRKLFEKAKKMAPCIVFIDEIDAIGSRRASNNGAESENNQTLNQLLVEMDGFETNETVIVLAATNRPEMLDKALLRPGRFDRQITIPVPDLNGREAILELHSKDKKLAEDVNLKEIAGDTAGFTGAELSNILNEAAIIATKERHESIQNIDIENAVRKITVGLEKHNRVISEKDKKLTAYHEAGHAVVSKFLPTQDDVKEVSIIPRGVAGGYTMYKTNEDKFYVSRTELLEKMVALMGGRAAESLVLNEISTGASNDLEVATGIARDMLTVYGMSDSLGPISLKVDEAYELQIFGEEVVNEVGNQIRGLVENAYVTAQKILSDHRDVLDKVAESLLEKEKITAGEFESFFEN